MHIIEIAFEENIIEDRAHVVKASLETVRQLGQGELTVVWLLFKRNDCRALLWNGINWDKMCRKSLKRIFLNSEN